MKTQFILLFTILLNLTALVQAQTFNSLTVTETQTNHYNGYQLDFTVSSSMDVGAGTFTITFDNAISVPSSIDANFITVTNTVDPNGTDTGSPSSVSVSGNSITFATPVRFKTNGPPNGRIFNGRITISSSAQIRNPSTSSYAADVSLSSSIDGAFGTDTFTTTTSTTVVSSVAVTPSTSVENRTAKYSINFNVGRGGYLENGTSTVTITFPVGTTIPNGNLSGVTFNSTTTTAVGNSSTRIVTVDAPIDIDNEGSVSIVFPKTTDLKNPTTGTFTLTVKTSSETTNISSSNYTISSADNLSFSSIVTSNDTVNATSNYEIEFVVSNTGALSSTLNDRIKLVFPSEVKLPGFISTSNVIVSNLTSGFSNNPSSVTIDTDTISIPVPIPVGNTEEVRVTFSQGAGLINPSTPGNYSLDVTTVESDGFTTIDDATTSNLFTYVASTSTLSGISVLPNDGTPSQTNVTYAFELISGDYGGLREDAELLVKFPSGTAFGTLSGSINSTATAVPTNSGLEVTVVVPASVEIGNNESFTMEIGGITNPGSGSYTLEVKSSPEPTYVSSNSYTIGLSSVSSVTVTVQNNTDTTNIAGDYLINITGATQLNGPSVSNEYIRIQFPDGTSMPASIANTAVSLNGGAPGNGVSSVSVNQGSRTVDVTVSTNNFTPTSVRFLTGATIVNPAVPSGSYYKVYLSTSQNTSPKQSGAYTINGSARKPVVESVSASPNNYTANAAYTISFTTSAVGKLKGGTAAGSDSIIVNFGLNITVPGSISTAYVKLNGNTVNAVNVLGGGFVEVIMPSGVTIGNSSTATLVFEIDAGLVNSSNATETISLKTSTDNTYSTELNNLALVNALELSVGNVILSDTKKNNQAGYTIKFTPGTSLISGDLDQFTVIFPTNTSVPAIISKSNILVGSSNPVSNPTISGREVTITTPTDLNSGVEVTVQFSSSAGILNPTITGSSYTLDISTTHEAAATSQTYSITSASSTVSTAGITLSNYDLGSGTGTNVDYTISFNTGSNGRLISETAPLPYDFHLIRIFQELMANPFL